MNHSRRTRRRLHLLPRFVPLALIAGALALYSCYPGGATNVSDYDLVITAFDESFDFAAAQTYAMPDSVVQLDSTRTISSSNQTLILNTIENNMDSLGYTRILAPDTNNVPDLVVYCASTAQDWAAWVSYPWYPYWGWWGGWGYYPPYYGGGWGWYYPPTVSYYEYTVGTVIIDIASALPDTTDQRIQVRWGAAILGLLEDTQAGIQNRAVSSINQAFEQSPYLATN
jgi:hypothetical protein